MKALSLVIAICIMASLLIGINLGAIARQCYWEGYSDCVKRHYREAEYDYHKQQYRAGYSAALTDMADAKRSD